MDDLNFLHKSYQTETALPEIVLVEDDELFGRSVKKYLEKKTSLKVNYFTTTSQCIEFFSLESPRPYCLITDISFAEDGTDGLLLIDLLREKGHTFFSIVMTGYASIETAIAATKKGVFHYLTKPFELEVLVELVIKGVDTELGVRLDTKGIDLLSRSNSSVFLSKFKIEPPRKEDIFCGMIGRSKKMKELFKRIERVAPSESTVFVSGPSGTGKELVAKALHSLSTRNQNKLVSVNCGAIPGGLLESELFGHIKGAFTGAVSTRKGRFEIANTGTIFLDEIGDMPLLLQVKILRVLQNREIEAVGSSTTTQVDVRIITATHRDLEKRVKEGLFREDLYYRLNVIPLRVPALAERREDIPLLISYFLSRFVSADGSNNIDFDDEALELLMAYEWPGNVRELENLMERLVILKGGSMIHASDLPAKFLRNRPFSYQFASELITLPDDGIDLKRTLSEIEDSLILQALDSTEGNKNQASKLLHMNRTTLIEKMKKKGLLTL